MNTQVIERELLDEAVRKFVASSTGRPCHRVSVPEDEDPKVPYSLLYPVAGGGFAGSMAYPDYRANLVYQVTSVGKSAQQATWLGDRVRKAWLGRQSDGSFISTVAAPEGLAIMGRSTDSGAGGVQDGEGGLFFVPEGFVLSVMRT